MESSEARRMQEAGAEVIPEGWQNRRIGECCELVKKQFMPSKDNTRLYIGLEHIQQNSLKLSSVGSSELVESNKYEFKSGQILFGKLRPYFRKVYLPKFNGVCSTDIWVINVKEPNYDVFFFYFFADKRIIDEANNSSEGTRMPRARWDYLEQLKFPIPQFLEQKAIAKILAEFDSKIKLNEEMNQTLEAMGQTIFKRWFVDFEFPNEEGKPYKSSDGEMVCDSNLNKNIPRTWSIGSFGDVAKIQPGYAFQSKDFVDNGYKIIKIADIQDSVVDTQSGDYVSEDLFSKMDDRFHVVSGDVVIAMTGAKLGKVGIVPNVHSQMLLNQRVGKVVSHDKFFSYLFLTQYETQDLMRGYSSGSSAQGNISNSDIEQIGITLPENRILNAFTKKTYPLYEKLVRNLGENIVLKTIRDLLLPKLMSGKIRVPVPQEAVET